MVFPLRRHSKRMARLLNHCIVALALRRLEGFHINGNTLLFEFEHTEVAGRSDRKSEHENVVAEERQEAVTSCQATRTSATPISVLMVASTQTDADPELASTSTQTDASSRSIASQYDPQSPLVFEPKRAQSDLVARWTSLSSVSPDSLAELVLHPARSVWIWLYNTTEEARKAFKLREAEPEMERLSMRWLEIATARDEISTHSRVSTNLTRLLKVSSSPKSRCMPQVGS